MKKLSRILNREEKRIQSFLLAMLFVLTSIFAAGILMPLIALAEDNVDPRVIDTGKEQLIIRDDALHFIFRHWHIAWDEESVYQNAKDQYDPDTDRYFVMVEGYIIPRTEEEMKNDPDDLKVGEGSNRESLNKFTIVLVNQQTGDLIKASELYNDHNGDNSLYQNIVVKQDGKTVIELKDPESSYLGVMDKTNGSIELKVKKITRHYDDENGKPVEEPGEKFCGVSLSAGRNAAHFVKGPGPDGETESIIIEYANQKVEDTHLVKGHIFYSGWTKTVTGTVDERLIDPNNTAVDTAEVYTWRQNTKIGDTVFAEGSIVAYNGDKFVKYDAEGATPLKQGDEKKLEELCQKYSVTMTQNKNDVSADIVLTTFYSSFEGLHTNKTLVQSAEGRYFLFDLEAWYIEGYAAQLGYVLDASGSMAGTSDIPSILNIYVAIANRLGIRFYPTDREVDDNGVKIKAGEYHYSHKSDTKGYHTHSYLTCSMPYYECLDGAGKVIKVVREDNITLTIWIQRANATEPEKHDNVSLGKIAELEAELEKDPDAFDVVKVDRVYNRLEDLRKDTDIVTINTYYAPTDDERRIDMEKFLIDGDVTQGEPDPNGNWKRWRGLETEFGKKELCETISKTLGPDYTFTETMWDRVAAKKGAAEVYKDTNNAEAYVYPQRESLIGYYEIMDTKVGNKRTWYFNSIDVKTNSAGIRPYITLAANDSFYNKYNTDYFALAAYPQARTTVNGGAFNFSKNVKAIIEYTDFAGLGGFSLPSSGPGWGTVPANFSATDGFNLAGGGNGYADSGFMLSSASTPKSGNFTISFDVVMSNWGDSDAEILYIGSYDGTIDNADFRLVRENKNIVLYHGGTRVVLVSNYTTTTRQRFTLTYDKNAQTVVFYIGATSKKVVKNVDINKVECIVFDPFYDGEAYSGDVTKVPNAKHFWIDDILVYDTELIMTEVSQLVNAKKTDIDNTTTRDISWDNIFLEDDLLVLFMNPLKTSHVELGVAAYNYFVVQGNEYMPLGYWDGVTTDTTTVSGTTLAKTQNGTILGTLLNDPGKKAGWYYVTFSSDNNILKKAGTDKRLVASAGGTVLDNVPLNHKFEWTGGSVGDDMDTGKKYTSTTGETIPFYIDANGNLRCFFSTGNSYNSGVYSSYVYELDDTDYVKTEALQRILAYFTAELSDASPSSKIAATQFSTTNRDYDANVLLDWSSDTDEIASILSQKRGAAIPDKTEGVDFSGGKTAGTAYGWDLSDGGVKQYNYSLTGSTTTYYGLQAFLEFVVFKGVEIKVTNDKATYKDKATGKEIEDLNELTKAKYRRDDPDAPKFVIVFTDGADSDYYSGTTRTGRNPAKQFADLLKDYLNYTVIGMYIPSGTDERNEDSSLALKKNNGEDTQYGLAREFLLTLATDDYVYASTHASAVRGIFRSKIIEAISGIMAGYTVNDYIDPRFDLQQHNGTVWHLNNNGRIVIDSVETYERNKDGSFKVDSEGNRILSTVEIRFGLDGKISKTFSYLADGSSYELPSEYYLTDTMGAYFALAGKNTNGTAANALLRYDSSKDMYYLEWSNQTIQSSPIGSSYMMPVWSVEYWLVAKDDFIGGDEVLTSGNGEFMNWIHHTAEIDEQHFAQYVINKWLESDSSMQGLYVSNWDQMLTYAISNPDKLNEWGQRYKKTAKLDIQKYIANWRALTYSEQQELLKVWIGTQENPGVLDNLFAQARKEKDDLRKKDPNGNYPYWEEIWNDADKLKKEIDGWDTIGFDGKDSLIYEAFIMFIIGQLGIKHSNTYDASSGYGDMKKTKLSDGEYITAKDKYGNEVKIPAIDEYVSKGFPRIAVNVLPKPVYEGMLESAIYLGEVMSPALILNNMVNNNVDNTYLNYLMRYAYYLYPNSATPLLDLLKQWDRNSANTFSVPYMYLPNVQYNVNGNVVKAGNKAVQLNSAGTKAHQDDVLGILTFHWDQISPMTDSVLNKFNVSTVVNDQFMEVWKDLTYRLSVEFTVFRAGDTYDSVKKDCTKTGDCDANCVHVDIFNTMFIYKDVNKDGRVDFDDLLLYDRAKYLNGTVKTHDDGTPPTREGGLVTEVEFEAKTSLQSQSEDMDETDKSDTMDNTGDDVVPDVSETTVVALADLMGISEDDVKNTVQSIDTFVNHDRTQQAVFIYAPHVVGAELALELQIYGNQLKSWDDYTIELVVQRSFTDNDYAESLKRQITNDTVKQLLDDYGNTFNIKYTFDKDSIKASLGDISALDDDTQYTIHAKGVVTGMFGGKSSSVNTRAIAVQDDEPTITSMSALPVGDYTVSTNSVTGKGYFDLKSLSGVTSSDNYKSDYFDVNGSLFGTKDNPRDVSGNIAHVKSSNNGATVISFGTTNGARDYGSVMCMIDIITSPTVNAIIIIQERGGKANESFLYKVTNVNTDVSIIVSVKGGSQTAIVVSQGKYKVEEISDWSWRYDDGKATATAGNWTIATGSATATTEVNDNSTRIVTYSHNPNNKPWLGGENFARSK